MTWSALGLGAACLALGVGAGALYFYALWRSICHYAVEGRRLAAVALTLCRFAGLAALLAAAGFLGPLPLLAMTAGVAAGRLAVVRRLREAAP